MGPAAVFGGSCTLYCQLVHYRPMHDTKNTPAAVPKGPGGAAAARICLKNMKIFVENKYRWTAVDGDDYAHETRIDEAIQAAIRQTINRRR